MPIIRNAYTPHRLPPEVTPLRLIEARRRLDDFVVRAYTYGEVSEHFRALMVHRGLTVKDLADALGIKRNYIHHAEKQLKDKTPKRPKALETMRKIMACSI